MEQKEYSIDINYPKEKIWEIMLGEETYPQWIEAFSDNSHKEGEWEQGTYMNFIDDNMGGTRAFLEVVDKPNRVLAKHIALLSKDGEEDTQSEDFQKWNNTTEEYLLEESNGITKVKIIMNCHKEYLPMFDSAWPEALKKLKALCEQ